MYNTKLVWILSDNKSGWLEKLFSYGFVKAVALGERGQNGEAALAEFKAALKEGKPSFALWCFAKERGEAYLKGLESFINICKENGVEPVLTTYVEASSKKKNFLTEKSGARFIDLASLSEYDNITTTRGYSKHGKEAIAAKVLVDFPEIITPDIKVRKSNANLYETGKLSLGANKVRDGKYLVFSARFDGELKEGQKIMFGHGYMESYGKWIEITKNDIIFPSYTSWLKPPYREKISSHGVTVKNYVIGIVTADNDGYGNCVTVITDGAVIRKSGYGWNACQGEIFVSGKDIELSDVKAAWTCEDYSAPIWFVGASYFSLGDPARWPYYMYADGYADKVFITGRGGMNGINGHEEIADAIKFAKPKFMIWGIGMNDGPDLPDDINPATYQNKLGFLKICKEQGIKPLFMTIPNCGNEANQRNENTYKLDYINNRRKEFADYDYRVVDIAHSVNGVESHSPWYDGMLHSDGTHPTNLGARNFYLELLCEFPELMVGADANINAVKEKSLKAGQTIAVNAKELTVENAITFKADFKGRTLDGALTVGCKANGEGSFLRLTEETLEVYKLSGGKEILVHSEANRMNMKELVMLRIHVKDGRANIALVSSGEKDYVPHDKLYTVMAEWNSVGEAFAVADKTDMTDADLKFTTI